MRAVDRSSVLPLPTRRKTQAAREMDPQMPDIASCGVRATARASSGDPAIARRLLARTVREQASQKGQGTMCMCMHAANGCQ